MTKEDVEDASGEGEQESWFESLRVGLKSVSWRDCC